MTVIPLRKMMKDQSGIISQVKSGGEVGLRIREMGLVPGTAVTVVRRAPLNDPVHLKLFGSSLTLRNNEADCIMVDVTVGGAQ